MTYDQALRLKICPNCRKPLYNIAQEVGNIGQTDYHIVKFYHKNGDFCEDWINLEFFGDPRNKYYFDYIKNLYSIIKPMEIDNVQNN